MDISNEEKKIIYKKMGVNLGMKRGERSQKNIAELINMKEGNYNTIEAGKGERHLKDIQLIKLAKFYNVSTDYLLGLTDEPSCVPEVQEINQKYGLTEKALKNLEKYNLIAKKDKTFTHIETLNLILSQENLKIWTLIDRYLNMKIEDERIMAINEEGKVELSNTLEKKSTNLSLLDVVEGGILQQLSINLTKLKKEGEK